MQFGPCDGWIRRRPAQFNEQKTNNGCLCLTYLVTPKQTCALYFEMIPSVLTSCGALIKI